MLRRGWVLISVLVVALLLSSCARKGPEPASPQTGGPRSGGEYVIGLEDAWSLDPATWGNQGPMRNIFNGLLRYTADGKQLEGDLAEDWSVSPDGKTYTFKLRQGVKFHNGRELVADDVKYSIERVLNPKTKSDGAFAFADVVGAQEFNQGKAKEVSGIQVGDPHTVQITLKEPLAIFPYFLAMNFGYVVPREAAEQYGDNFARHPVGTGPFKFEEWKEGEYIKLVKNPDYFEKGLPYLDSLVYRIIPDSATLAMQFEAGQIHEMYPIPDSVFQRVVSSGKYQILEQSRPDVFGLAMNVRKKPFDDVRVRRAIAYAINREKVVQVLFSGGRARPALGPIPPGLLGYDPQIKAIGYDPERAKQLLADAGYSKGLECELWTLSRDSEKRFAEFIASQLAEVGIKVQIRLMQTGAFFDAVSRGDAGLFWWGWTADYADPDTFMYSLFNSANWGINNPCFYKNPRVDELTSQARHIMDQARREAMYKEAAQIVVDEAPWAFIYHTTAFWAVNPGVRGADAQLHVYGYLSRARTWLEK